MTIETDGLEPAPDAAASAEAPASVETPSEATTDQSTGTETPAEPDAGAEQDKPKQVPWFQKRIDEVTRQKYEEQRRADYLAGQLAALQAPARQPAPTGPPTEEEYNWDQAAYREALDRYVAEQAEKAADRAFQKRTSEQQQQTQLETATNRLKEGAAKHSDFEAAVHDIPITEAVRELLVGDPNAATILYQVGRDAAEKARIFSLPPYQQAVELGKIAARLESPAPGSPKPIPPAPPATVGAVSAGLSKSLGEMSMAEFIAARNEGKS